MASMSASILKLAGPLRTLRQPVVLQPTAAKRPVIRLPCLRTARFNSAKLGPQQPKKPSPDEVEIPVFDSSILGKNKTVRYFVIGVVSVLGTIETVFWIKMGYAKFFGKEDSIPTD